MTHSDLGSACDALADVCGMFEWVRLHRRAGPGDSGVLTRAAQVHAGHREAGRGVHRVHGVV